jgi:hypothetical protein
MATIDELYQQSLLGNLPTTLTPYQQIMGQMTPTMNPYTGAGVAIGGYDPALYRRMSGSGLINLGGAGGGGSGGMGGGGGDSGGGSGGFSNPFSDLTQAQQAAYYAENPNMASVTRGLQGLFGLTSLGALQNYFNPGFVSEQGLIAMGVDPATYQNARESFRAREINAMNAEAAAAANAAQNAQSMQSMQDALNADTAAAQAQSISDQSSAGSEAGGYGTGDTSGGFGEGQYNMGGPVDRVGGPNPPGPDDGAGMLQLGEYVIKKSAVKKYGAGLLDMINDGKIPAKKMKSLLG